MAEILKPTVAYPKVRAKLETLIVGNTRQLRVEFDRETRGLDFTQEQAIAFANAILAKVATDRKIFPSIAMPKDPPA